MTDSSATHSHQSLEPLFTRLRTSEHSDITITTDTHSHEICSEHIKLADKNERRNKMKAFNFDCSVLLFSNNVLLLKNAQWRWGGEATGSVHHFMPLGHLLFYSFIHSFVKSISSRADNHCIIDQKLIGPNSIKM